MEKKQYYHVSSSALEKSNIFQSREDFVTGMNDIALCVLRYDVAILCFCLMNNHFHFVIKGTYGDCHAFVSEYKRMCAMRMRTNNGEVNGLKDVSIHFDHLDSQNYLENAIAYVLRNPIAAKMIMMPYMYEWSSVLAYFRNSSEMTGLQLNTLSIRKRREILRTRHEAIPDHYHLSPHGYIHPSCYVAAEEVESIFGHPSRLMFALAKKVENEFEVLSGAAGQIVMTDSELKTHILELIQNEFKVCSMAQLSADDRLRLCLLVKRNFNASVKQIARILRLSHSLVASLV